MVLIHLALLEILSRKDATVISTIYRSTLGLRLQSLASVEEHDEAKALAGTFLKHLESGFDQNASLSICKRGQGTRFQPRRIRFVAEAHCFDSSLGNISDAGNNNAKRI
ncbi:hypothetical protein E6O75_ATG07597 [Venturia nashicola]|uniref:Uncharacterized protein n=1 Tax=Venturia nashicola TaxID=86259 RepID=A0A4Z1NVL3_9PEZI|nr:hypothetical protein E6O75_ATG07597 [Venturia nashicola]